MAMIGFLAPKLRRLLGVSALAVAMSSPSSVLAQAQAPTVVAPVPVNGQPVSPTDGLGPEAARLWQEADQFHREHRLPEAASKTHELIVAIQATVGERHPSYGTATYNLGLISAQQGDGAGALAVFEGLAVHKQTLGEYDGVYVQAVNQAARVLAGQGDVAGAQARFGRALQTVQMTVGEQHPVFADLLGKQALFLRDQGDMAGAQAGLERAAALLTASVGEGHPATLDVLRSMAGLFTTQGKADEARAVHEKVAAIIKKLAGEHHPAYADALNDLARFNAAQGRFADARNQLEAVLAIRKEVFGEAHPAYAESLSNLASILSEQGQYAEARPLQERATAIMKAAFGERNPSYATSLNNLAELYRQQADFDTARRLHEQVLTIRKEVLGERSPDYAASLTNLALVEWKQGDYVSARQHMERSAALMRDLRGPNDPTYATTVSNLAVIRLDAGDDEDARRLFEEVLAIRKEVLGVKHPLYAATLADLGSLYLSQGNIPAARPLLEQALAIRKETLGDDHPETILNQNNLAMLLQDAGDYAAARPLFAAALTASRKALGDNHSTTAFYMNNLAGLCFEEGDYATARPLLEESLAAIKASQGEGSQEYGRALLNVAQFLPSGEARPLVEKAREVFEAGVGKRNPGYPLALMNLGRLVWDQGDLTSARTLFEQARDASRIAHGERHPLHAVVLFELGDFLLEIGQGQEARPLFEQALAISRETLGEQSLYTAQYRAALGRAHQQLGNLDEAERELRQALQVQRWHLGLAADSRSVRQQLELTRALRTSLDLYVSLGLDSGLPEDSSYREVLAWKGVILGRQSWERRMRRMSPPGLQADVDRAVAELMVVNDRLATLVLIRRELEPPNNWARRVADLTTEKDRLEGRLAELCGRPPAGRAPTSAGVDGLRATLPRDVALVDFLVYRHMSPPAQGETAWRREDRVVAFILRQDHPVVRVALGPIQPIREQVDRWRILNGAGPDADPPKPGAVGSRPTRTDRSGSASRPAEVLRQSIWLPIEPHLANVSTVLVSPDDALARLPMGALPGTEPGRYLIEERAFAVIPVPSLVPELLQAERADPEMGRGLLAVGDVDYDSAPANGPMIDRATGAAVVANGVGKLHFERLAATGPEALAVRDLFVRLFPTESVQLLEHGEATAEAVGRISAGARWVHLATHGYFAPPSLVSFLGPTPDTAGGPAFSKGAINPLGASGVVAFHPGLLSGLALAGANRPNDSVLNSGILTSLQVADLDLSRVGLVTLSACETGLGRSAGGEGLLGMQRAFQAAGAGCTVSSLWAVNDEATRILMERFYENLWVKGQGKLKSLHDAQLGMLREERSRRPALDRQARGTERVENDGPVSNVPPGRLPPYFWAAFVLSGDWR